MYIIYNFPDTQVTLILMLKKLDVLFYLRLKLIVVFLHVQVILNTFRKQNYYGASIGR